MEIKQIENYAKKQFDEVLMPTLQEYITIPNQSPAFDPQWETNGLIEKACNLIVDFINKLAIKGAHLQVLKDPKFTPLIYVDIDGTNSNDKSMLFYAHYDKQPPMDESKWEHGKPYKPEIIGDRLYGRGASDDGYGPLSIALAIKTLQQHNIAHGRCVLIFEGAEESGDDHVLHYIEAQKEKIGKLDLIVCMDSSCGDYKHLWNLISLRGVLNFVINVSYLREGVHSGQNGGIVADPFNICRILMDRIENSKTGNMIEDLNVKISDDVKNKFIKAAEVIGDDIHLKRPFLTGCTHMLPHTDNAELLLRSTWKPSLAVLGIGGMPDIANAGNVLRPDATLKLSIRLPPSLDPLKAEEAVKKVLLADPPFGAEIKITNVSSGVGFNSPSYPKWLEECLDVCSKYFYKTESLYYGSGGSIPLMGILSKMYPGVPLWVAGVLGPESNSHSVNEMLPISYTKNMLCVIAKVIADFSSKK